MRTVCVMVMGIFAIATAATAQKTTQIHAGRGGSPHVRTDWTVGGANISIEYGRPYLKGRTIGKDIVQYGHVWRAGADEATTLKTDKTLMLGNLTVPPGTYTLWVTPAADKWQLIVSKKTGQWGTEYDQAQDLGRVDMKIEKPAAPVEQLTFSIEPQPSGGILKLEFGTVRASVPFGVK